MTVVELFDKSAVENVISCLTFRPDKLIYLGDRKFMERESRGLCKLLEKRFPDTRVEFRGVIQSDLDNILSVLTEVLEENPDCTFDITGGDDLLIFAMGILFREYRDRELPVHRFNVRTGRVTDYDADGQFTMKESPALSVEDTITLHGGMVVSGKTEASWIFDEGFRADLASLWEVCRRDCARWNTQASVLASLYNLRQAEEDPLLVRVDLNAAESAWGQNRADREFDGFLAELCKAGMLLDCRYEAPMLTYRYKSGQVKRCLEKAGNLLELLTCVTAKNLKTARGAPRFSDAMTGVTIDWDGEHHVRGSGETDTENEIDVILMKGLVPVFISCKNGSVGEDELYKLHTVALRFGGKYVRKVLVGTTLGRMPANSREHFLRRAKEMNIEVLADLQLLDAEGFARALSKLDI